MGRKQNPSWNLKILTGIRETWEILFIESAEENTSLLLLVNILGKLVVALSQRTTSPISQKLKYYTTQVPDILKVIPRYDLFNCSIDIMKQAFSYHKN